MITNAQLLRIDRSDGGAGGEPVITTGDDLSAAAGGAPRCFLGPISSSQRYTLGAVLKDASQVLYIPPGSLQAVSQAEPATSDRLLVKHDGEDDSASWEAVTVNPFKKPLLAVLEVFLKKV